MLLQYALFYFTILCFSLSLSIFLKKQNKTNFPFVCLFPVSFSSKYLPLSYMLGALPKVNRTA